MNPPDAQPGRDLGWRVGVGVAVALHFVLAVQNFSATFMPGHEFRQAQTALISYYIDQDDDFSLLYEVPILGKPWVGLLLEVPIYEWSVVGISRLLDCSHLSAARGLSLACFYASLPALHLLLAWAGVSRPRRRFALVVVLTSPVYIFYSRAFLMDSMVFMCCAWFLYAFLRGLETRRPAWLGLTIVTGTAAALIKSVVLAVWLPAAAAYGFWILGRELRTRAGARHVAGTILWGAASIGFALAALRWWISYTDPIKAAHPSGAIFTSSALSLGNWGLFNLQAMFGATTWAAILDCWRLAILPGTWLVGAMVVALAAAGTRRLLVLALISWFFLAQLLFPYAFAGQDYYYYACAVFVLGGLGVGWAGLLESRLPRWAAWPLLALLPAAQLHTYWHGYRPIQVVDAVGGYPYTEVIAEATPERSVIVVAGNDWAAMAPLYAQRRALMIRHGLEHDLAYLRRAFADLADEDVSALVLVGPLRENRALLELAAESFDLDPRQPTFVGDPTAVYVRRLYADGVRSRIRASARHSAVLQVPDAPVTETAPTDVAPALARSAFANVVPHPHRVYFQFGYDLSVVGGRKVLSAHPDADIWLRPPAEATRIRWEFGFHPPAYEKDGDRTDGVEFAVIGEAPGGATREIYRRVLDPVANAADRGELREEIPYTPVPGEVLRFTSRPHRGGAYDWVHWAAIEVR